MVRFTRDLDTLSCRAICPWLGSMPEPSGAMQVVRYDSTANSSMPIAGCLSHAEDTTPQRRFSDFISRLHKRWRQARLSYWRLSAWQGPIYRITSDLLCLEVIRSPV